MHERAGFEQIFRISHPLPGLGFWLISWALCPERNHHCIDIIHIITTTKNFHFIALAAMSDKGSGAVADDVKMESTDDDTKLDDLANAFEDLDFEEGNLITFTKPDDLANSHGNGSIDTDRFARAIIVRPLQPQNTRAPTHSMFARADTGKYFKVADMWLNKAKGSGNPYFNFKANTPGLNVAGNVYSRPGGKWEIVFKAEARCGACGVACGSCTRKG